MIDNMNVNILDCQEQVDFKGLQFEIKNAFVSLDVIEELLVEQLTTTCGTYNL